MEHVIAMEPMKRKWAPSRFDTELFCIPEVTAVSSRLVTVVFWNLCCSIKHIVAPYMFDCEHGIALHPVHAFRASSPAEGDVSWDCLSCGRNLGYILELQWGWPFETALCSAKSRLLSS